MYLRGCGGVAAESPSPHGGAAYEPQCASHHRPSSLGGGEGPAAGARLPLSAHVGGASMGTESAGSADAPAKTVPEFLAKAQPCTKSPPPRCDHCLGWLSVAEVAALRQAGPVDGDVRNNTSKPGLTEDQCCKR